MPAPPEKPAVVAAPPAPAPADTSAVARSDYELASRIGTVAAWEAFLAAHPTGFYADLAKVQRDRASAPRTAVVQPPTTPEPRKPTVDPAETTQLVHKELTRLGCYSSDVNNPWGRPSRRAMELFNRHSGLKLEVSAASTDTLQALRDKTARVCPVECRPGFTATDDGRCERKPGETAKKPDTKKPDTKKPADTAQSRRDRREATAAQRSRTPSGGGGAAKVICGMNGCINVRPGCRGEVRPSGRGDFAVELCGQ